MKTTLSSKPVRLFLVLAAFFVTNALVAEFIGVKIFAFEPSVGLPSLNWKLFGQSGSLMLSAGVLLWPVVFVMTDLINEYFGKRAVRFLSWLAAGLITYAFLMVFAAIQLTPADWWLSAYQNYGVPDMQAAFSQVMGQGLQIIIGSVLAFLLGQIIDAYIFHRLRILTGERKIWLRATGSTLVSQFIDSFVVLYIAFILLAPADRKWEISLFFAVGTVNYCYKFVVAVLMTPVIYAVHWLIDRYLGEHSLKLRMEARGKELG